jgi:hypothetical protein
MAKALQYRSSRILSFGIFHWTGFFMPDVLRIENDRLIIRRRAWLGLKSWEEEIRFDRIASLRLKKGFLTGQIVIETNGGGLQELYLSNLWKWQANRTAKALRENL